MKILFCSQAAHTGGGVEAWLEALSAALAERGWDVVTGLAKGRFHDPERYAARHRVFAPMAIDGSSGFREDRILTLLRLFERVRPDVVFPVNLDDAIAAAALWKTRGADARLALCVHGQGEDRLEQVRRYAPFLDLVASVSKRAALRLGALHIPTGVPAPVHDTPPREALRRLAYIGRLDSDKRVRDLVPLARALPEVEFHVVGSGPDEAYLRFGLRQLADALKAAASRRTPEPNAVFHGALSREALYAEIYPQVDGLVVLSEAEAGPIVAWEAMVHGVVPVVSDYVGRAEENVIRDGETGLVFPVGDMARAAERIRNAGAVRELSVRARTELPDAYREQPFGDAWDAALRAAVNAPPRRGTEADLPSLVSPGLLARLGLGIEGTSRLRRLLRRRFVHGDPGSEWPQ